MSFPRRSPGRPPAGSGGLLSEYVLTSANAPHPDPVPGRFRLRAFLPRLSPLARALLMWIESPPLSWALSSEGGPVQSVHTAMARVATATSRETIPEVWFSPSDPHPRPGNARGQDPDPCQHRRDHAQYHRPDPAVSHRTDWSLSTADPDRIPPKPVTFVRGQDAGQTPRQSRDAGVSHRPPADGSGVPSAHTELPLTGSTAAVVVCQW